MRKWMEIGKLSSAHHHISLCFSPPSIDVYLCIYCLQALEFDREGLTKLKKAVKAIYNSGNSKLIWLKRNFGSHENIFVSWIIQFEHNTNTINNHFVRCLCFIAHVENEMYLVRAMERLGSAALSKEEPDIGAAFLKFSVVTKELSALMKTLVSHISTRNSLFGCRIITSIHYISSDLI